MSKCLLFLRNRFPFSLPLTYSLHQQIKDEISNKNSVFPILEADGRQIESVTLWVLLNTEMAKTVTLGSANPLTVTNLRGGAL